MTVEYRIETRPPAWPQDLRDLLANVETATIGHFEHLGFLGPRIRPFVSSKAIGNAVTVAAPGRDGVVVYKAIDLLIPGDILIISRVDHDDIACVGGGVVAAAKARGAVGIVVDGPCTDAMEIAQSGFPVWCNGVSSKTTNRTYRIGGSINVPIACAGAAVLPGYAVLADDEGVFVADQGRMRQLAAVASERQERSRLLRPHLEAGKSIFEYQPPEKA